ncbi:hypothetical protein HK101_002703 [Irineochytrium annulatum]|nr:hypothetical protein HK101_002703 [Irineochytrium annulatum]
MSLPVHDAADADGPTAAKKRERSSAPAHWDVIKRARQDNGRPVIGLIDLPADVLEQIMLITAGRTTARFLSTCRRARSEIGTNEVLWKRKVVADFGFPGAPFEPARSLSCPRDDPLRVDPNAPSSPESAYDSDQMEPDHIIDADEIAALKADLNVPVPSAVAPEQWDAYVLHRVDGKLNEALESSAPLRAFPRALVHNRVTRVTGEWDMRLGPRNRVGEVGYNDTFELFLGRAGRKLWVARVEEGGGLAEAVWQSAEDEEVEPLAFRGDVMVLATADNLTGSPVPASSQVRVIWGLGGRARESDIDLSVDALEAVLKPDGSTAVSVGVCIVRAEGDLLVVLATVSYAFELHRSLQPDMVEEQDGSYAWTGFRRGDHDMVRKEKRANVMLAYRIDREGGSVKHLRGRDISATLGRYTDTWHAFRDRVLFGEDSDPGHVTYQDAGVTAEGWEFKEAGCLWCTDDDERDSTQGHLVCMDLLTGAVHWSAPLDKPADRIGPISGDGSSVLLHKDGAVFGLAFRKIEEGETWEAERCWPNEKVGIGEYMEAGVVEGEDEELGELVRETGRLKSLILREVVVWNQERVDGELKNHLLYLWEPFDDL